MAETKLCSNCGVTKALIAFPKNKSNKDGMHTYCKPCDSSRRKLALELKRCAELELTEPKYTEFGDLVFKHRKEAGITQETLGALVGVSKEQVRLWEKGKSLPRTKNLRILQEILKLELPPSATPGDNGRIPICSRECKQCGKEFPVYKAKTYFCSRPCSDAYIVASGGQALENNPQWRGGRFRGGNGYVSVKKPGHPLATSKGYVLEHRKVMYDHILQTEGWQIGPRDFVHHKNGIRDDNRLENLELWTLDHKDPPGVRLEDIQGIHNCPFCRCNPAE